MILYRLFEKEIFNGDGHVSHHISYYNFRSESKENSKYYQLEKIVESKIPKFYLPSRLGLSSATTKTPINAIHFEVDENVVQYPQIFGLPYTDEKFADGFYISKPIEALGQLSPYRVGYKPYYFLKYINNINKQKSLGILEDFIHVCCSQYAIGCLYDQDGKAIDNELHIELFPCLDMSSKAYTSYGVRYGTQAHRSTLIDTLVSKYGVSTDVIDNYAKKKFTLNHPYHIKIKLIDNEITSIKWYRQYNNV